MEFIILLFVFLIAFSMGWNFHKALVQHTNRKLAELLVQQELDDDIVKIVLERHNDMFFAYGKDDYKFLALAPTREELEDKLRELFPGKRFGATADNLKEVGFK
jgi:hypothetical protein